MCVCVVCVCVHSRRSFQPCPLSCLIRKAREVQSVRGLPLPSPASLLLCPRSPSALAGELRYISSLRNDSRCQTLLKGRAAPALPFPNSTMKSRTLRALIPSHALISARHLNNARTRILPGSMHGYDQKSWTPGHLSENSQSISYAVVLSQCPQIPSLDRYRRATQSRGFTSVLTSRCTTLTEKRKDRCKQTHRHQHKRGQHAADRHPGEADPDSEDGLPRVVRKAVEVRWARPEWGSPTAFRLPK